MRKFLIFIVSVLLLVFVIQHFFFSKHTDFKTVNDKTNILLLGIGGGTHDGPNLTDSIIFASLDSKKNTISLISIPRDVWVPDLQAKINTAYAVGEEKSQGKGLLLAKAVVQKVVGQPVDYGLRLDFSGFVKAIDMVGELDVKVDRTLDDYQYPIEGKEDASCGHTMDEIKSYAATSSSELEFFPCRFKHLHVDVGTQHMDGTEALQFVRSRHAMGVEGSDFARSQRQAKVITAFKEKVFSVQTIINPGKIISLYNIVKTSIDTDIPQSQFGDFVDLANKMRGAKVQSAVIDLGDATRPGLLTNPRPNAEYGYAWVLVPKAGPADYSEIHSFVACKVEHVGCPKPTQSVKAK